ncbi:MAG: peptidase [Halothiobacillaceae bacterium]
MFKVENESMTYCVAINVEGGLVFASDSRTNAGIDHVSTYTKMHTFLRPGERAFVLLSAGNLATTQAVVKQLGQDSESGEGSLYRLPSMSACADHIGHLSTMVQRQQAERDTANTNFEATFIFGGQIAGGDPELFMIYPQGNYIHESRSHPYLQIGEIKYGKPILDRVIRRDLSLETAARAALVSLDSTIRSNVTVGPPIDLAILRRDSTTLETRLHLEESDPFYRTLCERWQEGLMAGLTYLPRFPWEPAPQQQMPPAAPLPPDWAGSDQ